MKISTIYGDLDERELTCKQVNGEDSLKITHITEYYLGPQLVHRSAHITLKHSLALQGTVGVTR